MERHEPPWKHYIPIKISDDIKTKSQGDLVLLEKYPIPDEDPLLMIRCT